MSNSHGRNDLAQAVQSLIAGDLEAAHMIAQAHEGEPLADSIHAIIHRREGDYSNSLYWWRRVGDRAPEELRAIYGTDPADFVRRRQGALEGSAEAEECRRIEAEELKVLGTLVEAPHNA